MITQGKAYFLSALSDIPHCVLKNAYECKLADRERNTYRIALSMAEIKSSKRCQNLLESIRECREWDAAANEEQIVILEGLLGIKHITIDDMLEDEGLQRVDRDGSLVELGVVDEEVKYLEDVIQLPPLFTKMMNQATAITLLLTMCPPFPMIVTDRLMD